VQPISALSIAGTDRIVTVSGQVTGNSSFVKTGVGILRLTNATNNYTGDTIVSQGTLLLGPTGSIPAGSTVKLNSGVLANWNSSLTLGSNIQLIQNSTIDVERATTLTSTGTISGDFTYVGAPTGLTKTGLGTLVLGGTNTYLGATTINGGVLSISSDANLGNPGGSTVLPGGITFGVAGGHLAVTSSVTSNRVITMTAAGSINVAAGQTYINNAPTAGAGLLTINGPGTVILNGLNTTGVNSHDNTAISNGATLMTQAALGTPFGDVAVTINGGSLRVNTNGPGAAFVIPTVNFAGGSFIRLDAQMGNDIQLTATTLARVGAGTLAIVPGVDGNLGNTAGADARVLGTTILGQTTNNVPGLATLNNLGGVSGNNVNAVAGSILRLASSTDASASFVSYDPVLGFISATPASALTNTFAGSTSATIANINSATAITGTVDVFGLTTTANISGGTLRLRSMNTNDMGALIFNGTSTMSSNLIVNGLTPSVNLTGASTASTTTITVPSTAGLVVGMPISGPGIPVGATIATIASATTFTISSAATSTASNLTLVVNPATTGASEGIIYVSGNTGTAATISGGISARTITKTGAGELILSGSNGIYGALTVNNGTLTLGGSAAATRQTTALVLNDIAKLNVNGGNVTFASLAGTAGIVGNASTAANGTLTISGNTSTTFLGNIVNAINGGTKTTGLIKNGAGTLTLGTLTANNTLANQNSFTGGVTINQGVLIAQDPMALGGANGSTPGTVTLQGGELRLNSNGGGPNGNIIFGNPATNGINVAIAGSAIINVDRVTANTGNQIQIGNLSIANSTLSLTGGNSYSLRVAGTTALNGAYANVNTATAGATFLQLAGVVSGTAGLNKFGQGTTGYGTLRISGTANTFTGGTNIHAGAVQVTGTTGTPLGSGPVNVNAGAVLRIAGNGSIAGISSLNLNSNINSLPAIVLDTDYNPGTGLNTAIQMNGGFNAVLQLAVPAFNSALNMADYENGRLFLGAYGATEIQYLAPTLGVGADNTYRLGANTGASFAFVGSDNVLGTASGAGTARVVIGSPLGNIGGTTAGSGTVIFRNSNNYSGGTTINRGSAVILDTGAGGTSPLGSGIVEVFGTLRTGTPGGLNSPSFYNSVTNANNNVILMRPGSLVQIFDQLGSVADGQGRWADATGQDLNGGALRFDGVANAQSVETVGDITITKGSTLTVVRPAGSGSTTFNVGNLIRSAGSTLSITHTANQLGQPIANPVTSFERLTTTSVLTTGGLTNNGSGVVNGGMVAPWIIDATENSFMGYNVAGVGHGFQSLKSTGTPAAGQSEYTFRATAAGNFGSGRLVTDIVDIVTGTQTLNANTTIYALRTAQNIAPTASFNSLTLNSGGLIMTGGIINPVQTAAANVSPVTCK
jgi:fibronectin-binding autotransporter adhesin